MATYWSDMCNSRTAVYHAFSAEGELLYVGLTKNPSGRISQHRSKKPWWKADVSHVELDWYANRTLALNAERWAIHYGNPRYNLTRPRVECSECRT